MQYITNYEEQTKAIGKQLASMMNGGEIILLHGDLGAGKTTFTKGFAEELGVTDEITSPTFSIMNVYPISDSKINAKELIHIDTYRLEDEKELIEIGAEDYIGNKNVISLIEWPEKISTFLEHKKVINVHIEHVSENEREITIEN